MVIYSFQIMNKLSALSTILTLITYTHNVYPSAWKMQHPRIIRIGPTPMNVFKAHACIALFITLTTVACSPADATSGQARAVTCHACHGGNGMQTTPRTPELAGQNRLYIAKQLRDFRDGRRNDPVMEPLAKSLTNSQIEDIAAYFESLDSCSGP
jgi:cytochrome c553